MKLLNLGCGKRLHSAWINADVAPKTKGVSYVDLRKSLPFSDDGFAAVYASHVIEHLKAEEARSLVRECFRILKPRGVLRIVVPNLERIVSEYLRCLERGENCADGDLDQEETEANYDWMMLEMYDQTVREASGGEMASFMRNPDLVNERFVIERLGGQTRGHLRRGGTAKPARDPRFRNFLRSGRVADLRDWLLWRLDPEDYENLQVGRFRRSGEVHQWMYDRYSLGRLLRRSGFESSSVCSATESRIPSWPDYELDADLLGNPHKPDSLYIEAIKIA